MDYAREISNFAATAREYCRWCEEPRVTGPSALRYEAASLLGRLYSAAVSLPEVDLGDYEAPEPPDLPEATRTRVFAGFADFPFQYYREVFDPAADKTDEPVVGDLADDFTDIYLDLYRGLALLDMGEEPAAVFEWRFSFGIHWGRHATSAMRALHCYQPADE